MNELVSNHTLRLLYMNQNSQRFGNKNKETILACLHMVEKQKEMFKDCLHGRQLERELMVEHIKQAKVKDAEMLAAIDKDIVDFEAQLEQLEAAAAKFRLEVDDSSSE